MARSSQKNYSDPDLDQVSRIVFLIFHKYFVLFAHKCVSTKDYIEKTRMV